MNDRDRKKQARANSTDTEGLGREVGAMGSSHGATYIPF